MTSSDDHSYFARRAEQERRLAENAADSAIATTHSRLAAEYERRLADAAGPPVLAQPAAH
ncbi:MAG: hypothetical protein EOP61_00550 [Sphingomonadales bacterium]|nr:MAG: hypothetical protein EOP61_00550 [Sphingomonadales bacterium]